MQVVELVEERRAVGGGNWAGQVLLRAAADPGQEPAVGPDVADQVGGGVRARVGPPRVAGQDCGRPRPVLRVHELHRTASRSGR